MTAETQQNKISTADLWLSLASGPILWAAYHTLVYAISSLACQLGFWLEPVVGGINILALVLLGLTLAAAALMVYAGLRAVRSWKKINPGTQKIETGLEHSREGFMAISGIALNALFFFVTILTFVPIFFLGPCR